MRVRKPSNAGPRVALTALTITLVAAGSLVAAGVVGRPIPETVTPHIGVASTVVSFAETTQNQPATLTIAVEPARELGTGAGQGMLSAIHVDVGDELSQGSVLFDVDGKAVWALQSEAPIYRDIGHKDKGLDVAALQGFLLQEVGFQAPKVGTVDQATVNAIRKWQRETGQPRTGIAEAARFIWLPREFIISESKLVLGEPVPAPGDVMFIETNAQGTVKIVPEQPIDPGKYLVIALAEKIPVTYTQDLEWVFDKPQDLGRIVAIQKSLSTPEASDAASSVNKEFVIEARIERAESIVGVAVPAASVISSESSNGVCVWETGDGTNVRHTEVQILASVASGAVIVAQESHQGTLQEATLILDPVNQVADPVCP